MRPRRARLGCRHAAEMATRPEQRFNEAEARAPRMRMLVADRDTAQRTAASMRPRRARLGCGRAVRVRTRATDAGFNEAEARAPRMPTRLHWCQPRSWRRFNEAEARAPRMHRPDDVTTSRARPGAASMRPRRARLGCRHRTGFDADAQCFNEAEARAPRMQREGRSRMSTATRLQ